MIYFGGMRMQPLVHAYMHFSTTRKILSGAFVHIYNVATSADEIALRQANKAACTKAMHACAQMAVQANTSKKVSKHALSRGAQSACNERMRARPPARFKFQSPPCTPKPC